MQGGLAKNRLSFREVFTSRAASLLFVLIAIRFYATVDCRQVLHQGTVVDFLLELHNM